MTGGHVAKDVDRGYRKMDEFERWAEEWERRYPDVMSIG